MRAILALFALSVAFDAPLPTYAGGGCYGGCYGGQAQAPTLYSAPMQYSVTMPAASTTVEQTTTTTTTTHSAAPVIQRMLIPQQAPMCGQSQSYAAPQADPVVPLDPGCGASIQDAPLYLAQSFTPRGYGLSRGFAPSCGVQQQQFAPQFAPSCVQQQSFAPVSPIGVGGGGSLNITSNRRVIFRRGNGANALGAVNNGANVNINARKRVIFR